VSDRDGCGLAVGLVDEFIQVKTRIVVVRIVFCMTLGMPGVQVIGGVIDFPVGVPAGVPVVTFPSGSAVIIIDFRTGIRTGTTRAPTGS
jgi:hypothetical protein